MKRFLVAGLALLAVIPAMPAFANERLPPCCRPHNPRTATHRTDFADLVRGLVATGAVRPLKDVLDALKKANAGEVVGIKLRRQASGWVYHVKVLDHEHRREEFDIDGKTLKITETD